jgi:hypothetical protein
VASGQALQRRVNAKQHKFYCGIDLHARSMYLCILDQKGKTVLPYEWQNWTQFNAHPDLRISAKSATLLSKGSLHAALQTHRATFRKNRKNFLLTGYLYPLTRGGLISVGPLIILLSV